MNFPNIPQFPDPMFPINPFAPMQPPRSPRRSAGRSVRSRSPRRSHRHSQRRSHRHSARARSPRVIVVDNRSTAQRRIDDINRKMEEQRIRSEYAATQAGLFYHFFNWLFGRKRN
jgi:hypothetical protein